MKAKQTRIAEDEFLSSLRATIPFLKEITNRIYFELDPTELYLPIDDVARIRVELEERLGHYVMTYNADIFNLTIPVEKHLCANLKEAGLTDEQLKILQDYELQLRDQKVTFVAYQKPLELISPAESKLFKLYKEKGLIQKERVNRDSRVTTT